MKHNMYNYNYLRKIFFVESYKNSSVRKEKTNFIKIKTVTQLHLTEACLLTGKPIYKIIKSL